jgi:hypothetical protein
LVVEGCDTDTYRTTRMNWRLFARCGQLSASKAASFDKLHSRFEGRVIKKLVRRDSPVKLFFNRHLTNKPTVVPTALTNTFTGQKARTLLYL